MPLRADCGPAATSASAAAGRPGATEMSAEREAIELLLEARRYGRTLRQAAAAAGVHVATVCRWQARDPELRQALTDAASQSARRPAEGPRPRVSWRRDCPLCKAK